MTHAHHWIIDTPDGPTSPGVCVECGESRTFRNWGDGNAPEGWRGLSKQRRAFDAGIDSIISMRWTTRGEYVR